MMHNVAHTSDNLSIFFISTLFYMYGY